MSDTDKATDLTRKIEARAAALVASMALEVSANCGGRPEFEAILWHAVEHKVAIATMDAETRAAAIKGRRT